MKSMDKKKVWLDTNILIDFLTQRDSFGENATKIFTLAEDREIDVYMSILSFVNTYYILKISKMLFNTFQVKIL